MRSSRLRIALRVLLFVAWLVVCPIRAEESYLPDEVLLCLRPDVPLETIHARFGTSVLDYIPNTLYYRLALPPGSDVPRILALMYEAGFIEGGEPNYLLQTPEADQSSMAFVDQSSMPFVDRVSPPAYFGQTASLRVRSAEANQLATGRNVVVAVIDTGVALNHRGLVHRLALPFYDFVDDDEQPEDEPGGLGYGHGTFVSGVIALLAPEADIMPLRALDRDGRGHVFNIAKAIYFAVRQGARVINMSFGMSRPSEMIERAITYARSESRDRTRPIFLVASAGNANQSDPLQFPAGDKRVFAVAAVDDEDIKASFSNFGQHIALSAPGVGIYSTFPRTEGVGSDGFAWWSGTSFAAPFLSAEAALILERFPALRFGDLRDRIRDRDRLINIDSLNPLFEGLLGRGRIDLYLAVR